ncbi:N-acetylmuramoyl-L-alanine amidase [Mesonia sp. JHPTF-M18]|uniref:N-acetylmuramoyl-L-alanine amidase n=1 Tax=Mesonia aestuariivivens TaxID=2796128 RepID=A0ABS6VZR5_9FLAO|nr:N-acetylmuramoyl-L-alanine amidase [Mesonia aestuariivivens]
MFFTRTNKETISLEERVDYINKIKPDLVLSLHVNSDSRTEDHQGIEVYFTINNEFKEKILKWQIS